VLVREYKERDLDALRAIHAAQGFDYALPDLRNPLFVTKLVLSDTNVAPGFSPASSSGNLASTTVVAQHAAPQQWGSGGTEVPAARDARPAGTSSPSSDRILGAALLRLTAEAYLLLDPRAGTPRERWQWLLALHEVARRDAWQRGLEDVHAWLPPPIAQKFGRRLARLGWRRDDAWTPYCTRLGVE
jgi:hypothetical protein